MSNKKQDYIPFGEEWIAGMKKHSKEVLIDLLANAYKKNIETEEKNNWIKIESENDLPTESYVFWTLRRGFKYPMYKYVEVFTEEEKAYWMETYEYYQPIKKPINPFFIDKVEGC